MRYKYNMSYTDEQLRYINYDKKINTKLIACAGAGKTKTILGRITHLIETKTYNADSILILMFSRFTRDDFLNKIKDSRITCIPATAVSTIDKFAKLVIDKNNTVDVSLLSFKLLQYLEKTPATSLIEDPILSKIKIVFVDEGQDLNEIQYNIFVQLSQKLNVIINIVGDPNQNIFQFRGSDCRFLIEFDAVEFNITKNFRSHLPIVEFSKHLRPYAESDIIAHKNNNGCKPIMMMHENEHILEAEIIEILTNAKTNNIDLSQFAILSPTRGYMNSVGSHGLCFISNILYKAKIPFKQFYEESNDEVTGEGIKYEPVKNHVNVLSIMGSKGLEWNYVIIVDANNCLINKLFFNEQKHKNDQYMLYVATSRAIHNMYIFSACRYSNGQYVFNTNTWFKNVPPQYYVMDSNHTDHFYFGALKFRDKGHTLDNDKRLSKIIDTLTCYELDTLSTLLDFENRKIKYQHDMYQTSSQSNYSAIEKQSSIFLLKYTDALFLALYNIKMNRPLASFTEIENIIEGDTVVKNVSADVIDFYTKNKKSMTWEKFDSMRNLDPLIRTAINHHFDRTKPFNSHIIAVNGYYQMFILAQKVWIKNIYKKYLKCKNTNQIREILFYLVVIKHSIETQHYYHIKSKGKKYQHILKDFKDMFDDIEAYIDDIDYNFVRIHEIVDRWGIIARLDLIDASNKLTSVKCSNDISLKHTISSIVSYLMYNVDIVDDNFEIISYDTAQSTIDVVINFINLMKGEEISYIYYLNSDIIKKMFSILQSRLIGCNNNAPIIDIDVDTVLDQKIESTTDCETVVTTT